MRLHLKRATLRHAKRGLMLRYLFGGLTAQAKRGQALFDSVVAEARKPHWYVEGQVPDTIDGRFAVLATVCALAVARLERGSESGPSASAALTERFIEDMDGEHRELGLNDPGLGRRIRKLVGSLERRVDDWKAAAASELDWSETASASLYRSGDPVDSALAHSAAATAELWKRLTAASEDSLLKGEF